MDKKSAHDMTAEEWIEAKEQLSLQGSIDSKRIASAYKTRLLDAGLTDADLGEIEWFADLGCMRSKPGLLPVGTKLFIEASIYAMATWLTSVHSDHDHFTKVVDAINAALDTVDRIENAPAIVTGRKNLKASHSGGATTRKQAADKNVPLVKRYIELEKAHPDWSKNSIAERVANEKGRSARTVIRAVDRERQK